MASNLPTDGATFIFRFIGDVWLLLPFKDRRILSNFWASLIKITGDLQNRAFELDLSNAIQDIPVYNTEMWNSFTFDEETALSPSPSGEYPYSFFLGDSRIVSIPTLQERINGYSYLLREGEDYLVSNNVIYFKENPSDIFFNADNPILWAKDTFINNEAPFRNFGEFIDLYQENSEQYLRVLQGVWYAYWNGPSITNILTSLYLLFALPTAPFAGTITRIYLDDDDFLHIQVTSTDGLSVEDLIVPKGLDAIVTYGQTVEKFELLCSGIRVIDKEIDPDFMTTEVGRTGIQKYLTQNATRGAGDTDETKALELLAENLFVAQISGDTFVTEIDIPAVRNFLTTIKPRYADFVFQMLRLLEDYIVFGDRIDSKDIDIDITVNTENTPVNIIDDTRYEDYVTSGNINLNIDMDALSFREETTLEVYDTLDTLIDSFEASI